jgi:hypothetical protein
MGVSSKRRPYPFDARLHSPSGEVGVMLRATEAGEMVGRKVQPLERVQPADYTSQSLPPYVERQYPFKRLVMGMGEKAQATPEGHSYWYALWADCSIGGIAMKAPAFHTLTPSSTGQIRGFVEALDNGTLRTFALAGRYVLKRTGDTGAAWTVVGGLDLGSGHYFTSAARFKDGSASPVDALYAATDTGLLYRLKTDGSGWDELTAAWTGASAGQKAKYLAVIGNELWRGWDNFVSKTEGSPADGAVWSGRIAVGDGSQPITWLAGQQGALYAMKRDGIYTLNTDGSDNDLFPSLKSLPDDLNGQQTAAWSDSLWVPWGGSLYQVAVSGDAATLQPSGFERLLENDSEVRGVPTCSAGHGSWFNYVALYNAGTDTSYLCKLGTWLNPESETVGGEYRFLLVPHGALAKWAGKKATAMKVTSVPGPNPRLNVGFDDGSIEYAILPKDTPNPLNDSACEFTTTLGEIYWPEIQALAEADNKTWRALTAYGARLDHANYVSFRTRTESAASLTALPNYVTASGARLDFPTNTYSKRLWVVQELHNTLTSATPVVEGCALSYAVRPAFQLQYDLTIRAESFCARRDGTIDMRSGESIRRLVREVAAHPGSVDVELPDETITNVSALSYSESLLPKEKRFGPAWDLGLQIVEWQTVSVYGTIGRLEPYTVAGLGDLTIEQLGGL